MTSKVERFAIAAARRIFQAAWSGLLPTAGIACLGFTIAGCTSSFTPFQQQQARVNNPNSRYTIEDLGVFGANPAMPGGPLVVSNSGWISGAAAVGNAEHAVLYYRGNMIDIGTPGLGGNSMGYGVNEFGVAAGWAESTATGLSTTEDFCSADTVRPICLAERPDASAPDIRGRERVSNRDQQQRHDRRLCGDIYGGSRLHCAAKISVQACHLDKWRGSGTSFRD